MQRDLQFLLDMLQSAELILAYVAQSSKDEFVTNIQLQDAVIRRLLIIAEAAKRVSEVTRQALPNVSWQEINGIRNRLVHEYDDVNTSFGMWFKLKYHLYHLRFLQNLEDVLGRMILTASLKERGLAH